MNKCSSRIDAVNRILCGGAKECENVNVTREKKEKGLYERTEECRVMITEDNKMLLKD